MVTKNSSNDVIIMHAHRVQIYNEARIPVQGARRKGNQQTEFNIHRKNALNEAIMEKSLCI